ncbi:bifunctional 4-hydroxy-2-oxoglutarate aldolase/2-dehydro-3-deoxy-phosphogluconate aldolase [Streptomyces profundus]|nr:bifunctional 4-hydroxy-2-oxoglutarate aldolase/2-dehydro-3-deoxy-phosphogluconate aldolase [Streptomyces sp. MA3_2.13]
MAAQRLLPVLRSTDAAAAVDRTRRLLDAGCEAVELTTSTPDWAEALATLRAEGRGQLGVGTISTAEQAESAVRAGADFLVTPFPAPAVRPVAAEAGVVLIEGGFTPGEIADAAGRGPAKVFPAHVGGPRFLSSLRAVLPDAVLIPTGGISLAEAPSYLKAGALAVGIGSGLPEEPDELTAVFRDS